MSRPPCCRRISGEPAAALFGPAVAPAGDAGGVTMFLDELEAVRLADLEGLYHEQAAARMDVSRATFGRVLESGRRKVAGALVLGLTLRIEGGPVRVGKRCCRRPGRPATCPRLASASAAPCEVSKGRQARACEASTGSQQGACKALLQGEGT